MKQNTNLGILLSSIFYMLAVYYFLNNQLLFFLSILIGGILTLVTIFKPVIITPLTKVWFATSVKMAGIINPIILGVFFFLIITPISLGSKFFGRDELRLKKTNKKSYWIEKPDNSDISESFKKQY